MSHRSAEASYAIVSTSSTQISGVSPSSLKLLSKTFPVAVLRTVSSVPVDSTTPVVMLCTTWEQAHNATIHQSADMFDVWYIERSDRYEVCSSSERSQMTACRFVASFVGQGDAESFAAGVNQDKISGERYYIRHNDASHAPFVVENRTTAPTEKSDINSLVAEASTGAMAHWLAATLNRGWNTPANPDKLDSGPAGIGQVTEGFNDTKTYPNPISIHSIKTEVNHLAGRVLTILDASISLPTQNEALKKLVKKEFRSTLTDFWRESQRSVGEGSCGPATEDHLED
jgi:hypothetical protein